MVKVSVLISLYNAERFLPSLIEDLEAQNLYQQKQVELIFVVSGSPQGEADFLKKKFEGNPLVQIISTERETMYQAWNRAIAAARGQYLTNANADDRHAPDAFEQLVKMLDTDPSIDLVYADVFLSTIENETFQQNAQKKRYIYPRYFGPSSILCYQFGPQAIWRKSVHDKIGGFSNTLKAAGDYEFNLRFAEHGLRAKKFEERALGLYLAHTGAISFEDQTITKETDQLYAKYRTAPVIASLYQASGFSSSSSQFLNDMGIRAMCFYPPWFEGGQHAELALAELCFREALGISPENSAALCNLVQLLIAQGKYSEARALVGALPAQFAARCENLLTLVQQNKPGQLLLEPSGLTAPTEQELSAL